MDTIFTIQNSIFAYVQCAHIHMHTSDLDGQDTLQKRKQKQNHQ